MITLLSSLIAQPRELDPGRGEVGTGDFEGVPTIKGLEAVFENTVTVILGIAGIVLFILLVVGGFQFITAGGEPKKVEQARNTLTYAIFGIIAIAAAFLILRIIQEFTGADVTQFRIFQQSP